MEDELSFSDIYGGRLALQRRYYSPSCREFCLSCPRLSLRTLTAVTCTVWLAAYGLFTLCEVMDGLPFPAVGVRTRFWKGLWGLGIEPGLLPDLPSRRPEGRNPRALGTPFRCWTALSMTFGEVCAPVLDPSPGSLLCLVPPSIHPALARQSET